MFEEISEVFFENFREKWNWKDERTKSWWIFREADENWRGEEGWIDKIETNISENVKQYEEEDQGIELRDVAGWIDLRSKKKGTWNDESSLESFQGNFANVFARLPLTLLLFSLAWPAKKQPSPILISMRLEKPRKTRWARNWIVRWYLVWFGLLSQAISREDI